MLEFAIQILGLIFIKGRFDGMPVAFYPVGKRDFFAVAVPAAFMFALMMTAA